MKDELTFLVSVARCTTGLLSPLVGRELLHHLEQVYDLHAQPGRLADRDVFQPEITADGSGREPGAWAPASASDAASAGHACRHPQK